MEVRPVYKQTEVGVIPADWAVESLHNVVEFANGKPHEGNVRQDGQYCLITLDSIGIDGGLKTDHKRTDTWDNSLKKRDIVAVLSDLAHGNLLGLCDLIPEDNRYVLNQRMGRLRLKVSADPLFVRLQINKRQDHFRKRGQGTSQKHIYKRDFDSLDIPFPPEPEQRAIAAALSDADALLDGLDRLIAKKRDLKQAAMQQLLTGQTRLPGYEVKPRYEHTKVEVIPEDWDARQIGAEIDLLTGHPFPSTGYSESGVRLLRGSNVKRGKTDWKEDITQYWPTVSPDIARYELRQGDLVIAMDGSLVGRSYAQLKSEDLPALLLQRVARIRSTRIDVTYIAAFVGSERFIKYADSVKTVTAIPHISPDDIRKLKIPLPPTIKEQRAIAAVLTDMDAELAALEARFDKSRALKQGMMQELLTGRTRLVPAGAANA